jgi:hypothetical protein
MHPGAILFLAKPWFEKLPGMVSDELKTRGQIRIKREDARLALQVEERKTALTRVLERERRQHEIALRNIAFSLQHYPLGLPGRLLNLTTGHQPAVLISPPPKGLVAADAAGTQASIRVDELAYDWLREAPEIARYADLLTGAFTSDAGVPRAINGVAQAEEIVAAEFVSRPAILVFFERHATGVNVIAYLTRMFEADDGDFGFPIQVARFVTDGDPGAPPVATRADSDLPIWQHIDISGWPGRRDDVIAAVISWFILASLDAYWSMQGVPRTGLLRSALADQGTGGMALPTDASLSRADDRPERQLVRRLDTELTRLAQAGFELGDVVELGSNKVGVTAARGGTQIGFIVGPDYPAKPPLVMAVGATGQQSYEISEADWAPDRNLLEIAEGVA